MGLYFRIRVAAGEFFPGLAIIFLAVDFGKRGIEGFGDGLGAIVY